MFDILSDFLLFNEYMTSGPEMTVLTDSDTMLVNETNNAEQKNCTRRVTIAGKTADDHDFFCEGYDYWFALFTLLIIYLPSINVVISLYGPIRAGILGIVWGTIMMVIGGIFLILLDFASTMTGWFLLLIGTATLGLGSVSASTDFKNKTIIDRLNLQSVIFSFYSGLFLPLLFISPVLFSIINILSVLKPKNKLIKAQSELTSFLESILEAAPQLTFQIYIVLASMSITRTQVFSLVTSVLSLCIPNIEYYVKSKSNNFGLNAVVKNILVFLPISIHKILSLAIMCLLFKFWTILIIFCHLFVLFLTTCCCLCFDEGKDWTREFWECVFLSWLTISNLGSSRSAIRYRLAASLFYVLSYSIIFMMIIVINKENDSLWSDIYLANDKFIFNLLLCFSIFLAWLSLLLDFISASCRYHDWKLHNWGPLKKIANWFFDSHYETGNFWEGAVILEGLKFDFLNNISCCLLYI